MLSTLLSIRCRTDALKFGEVAFVRPSSVRYNTDYCPQRVRTRTARIAEKAFGTVVLAEPSFLGKYESIKNVWRTVGTSGYRQQLTYYVQQKQTDLQMSHIKNKEACEICQNGKPQKNPQLEIHTIRKFIHIRREPHRIHEGNSAHKLGKRDSNLNQRYEKKMQRNRWMWGLECSGLDNKKISNRIQIHESTSQNYNKRNPNER